MAKGILLLLAAIPDISVGKNSDHRPGGIELEKSASWLLFDGHMVKLCSACIIGWVVSSRNGSVARTAGLRK